MTKAEVEARLEKVQATLVAAQEENSKLQSKLNNIDAQRPGPTAEDQNAFDEQIKTRDEQIDGLKQQLLAADQRGDGLKKQIQELNLMMETEGQRGDDEALALVPVMGMVGQMPFDAGGLLTLATDVHGGGVLLVTKAGDALNVQFNPELKLAKKAGGFELQRRPDRR